MNASDTKVILGAIKQSGINTLSPPVARAASRLVVKVYAREIAKRWATPQVAALKAVLEVGREVVATMRKEKRRMEAALARMKAARAANPKVRGTSPKAPPVHGWRRAAR